MHQLDREEFRFFAGLYPHQIEGISFLTRKGRAILGDDMGLGKTRQAIVAMEQAAPDGVILVICPASLKLNWRREILAVDPEARIEVIGAKGATADAPRWVIVNYDLLAKQAERLRAINWSGVILDEAHFIKNASARTNHVLKLLGVSEKARDPVIGPGQVYLLTGTPMTNRPRDLYNLLRCVGHPSARSFLSFARRYCGAYRNNFGWVTDGASNIGELNLLMKEVMLRRLKDDVLDLPPKVRTWLPVEIDSATARHAQVGFLEWLAGSDPSRPNDKDFLGRLQKVRVALHKAKHNAVAERIHDVLATGQKVIVFTAFTDGLKKHKASLGEACVTLSGEDNAERRMAAVDAFQNDPEIRVMVANLIAGGVGITLTAGSHVIFQDLDWVPANLAQAEDRAYRLGQTSRVTVEYMIAARSLDGYVAQLLAAKMELIKAVEAAEVPDLSILQDLEAKLRALAPALLVEARAARASGDDAGRIQAIGAGVTRGDPAPAIVEMGVHEFPSSRDPSKVYRVTWGRGGHLECTCEGFRWRGDCKHARDVRKLTFEPGGTAA